MAISWSAVWRARSSQERQPQLARKRARLGGEAPRPARRACWKATISARPWTVSTTWAFSSPEASRAREPSRSMRAAPEHGLRAAYSEERQRARAPAATPNAPSATSTAAGTRTATKRRRDRVGEEVLDQLDVVGGRADQVARPAPREIGGRQRVELAEDVEPHVGEQPVRESWASHDSSQCRSAGERRHHEQARPAAAGRLAALDGARTTSALRTPTPISAATRATPSTNVTASWPR